MAIKEKRYVCVFLLVWERACVRACVCTRVRVLSCTFAGMGVGWCLGICECVCGGGDVCRCERVYECAWQGDRRRQMSRGSFVVRGVAGAEPGALERK